MVASVRCDCVGKDFAGVRLLGDPKKDLSALSWIVEVDVLVDPGRYRVKRIDETDLVQPEPTVLNVDRFIQLDLEI